MKRLFATALALGLSACATTGDDRPTKSWRKISQVEQRFAIFLNEPGSPKTGDLVTFRLAYVYIPGEVTYQNKPVAWQEYAAMTVNCASQQLRAGPRTRYSPDGAVLASDDDQTFTAIVAGTAADKAARARCEGGAGEAVFRVKDGPAWTSAARTHIASTPPGP